MSDKKGCGIISEDAVRQLEGMFSKVDEKRLRSIESRKSNWEERNKEIFKNNPKYKSIRQKMAGGSIFSAMDIETISDDMAFLAAFYDHLVELEGLVIAKLVLFSHHLDRNLNVIYTFKLIDGTKSDQKTKALGVFKDLRYMDNMIHEAEVDMAMLGLKQSNQTPRSEAVKMLIEVYKKRHDSKRARMVQP